MTPFVPWPKPPFDPDETRRRRGWLANTPVCAACGEQINGSAVKFHQWLIHEKCLQPRNGEGA
jgi:hypothetical protein